MQRFTVKIFGWGLNGLWLEVFLPGKMVRLSPTTLGPIGYNFSLHISRHTTAQSEMLEGGGRPRIAQNSTRSTAEKRVKQEV